MNRHADVADVEQYYMRNGHFWCLFDNEVLIGTVAIRIIDIENKVIELTRIWDAFNFHTVDESAQHFYRKLG